MGELEASNIIELLKETSPMGLFTAVICIGVILFFYRKQLYDIFETYVFGRLSKNKKDSGESNALTESDAAAILQSLRDEIKEIRDMQEDLKVKQDQLTYNISEMQAEVVITKDKILHISESQEFLMSSDKEDKKAYITREYNYFCGKIGKIDLYSKDTIEKIYELYLKEGGDSFVKGMMTAIRALPIIGQPSTSTQYTEIPGHMDSYHEE